MAADENHAGHRHGDVKLDEAGWRAWADQIEREGEVLLGFVTDTAELITQLRGTGAPPVRRVVDIGSGPGVGTCELARRFPGATMIAIDSSPTMLDRTTQRAARRGLTSRISTHLAELPAGLDGLGHADVIWASMALHHVGDEVALLRILRDLADPHGLVAVAEMAGAMRVLPDTLDVGRPGFLDRLDAAGAKWFAEMREDLPDSVPSTDLTSMLAAAGLEVVVDRVSRIRLDAPLSFDAREVASGHLRRVRDHLQGHLDDDDLHTLDVLTDTDDPRSVSHRSDVFLAASRRILIARPTGES